MEVVNLFWTAACSVVWAPSSDFNCKSSASPNTEISTGVNHDATHQLRVSGLIVLSLFLCFHQVRQLAFSRRTPFAISFLCRVMDLQLAQTSSSCQSWER